MTETLKHANCEITIDQDTDPVSFREQCDNAEVMICWHWRYCLGDKHNHETPADFRDWWAENGTGGVLLPLYLYDHSGLRFSAKPFSCQWDSGQVGYCYVTRDIIDREWGGDAEKAEAYMLLQVAAYDQYLAGDVWCYGVKHESGQEESCSGLYGYDYCVTEAKAVAASLDQWVSKQTKLLEEAMHI